MGGELSDRPGMLAWVGAHFFIDETKAKGYVVVAVVCPDLSLAHARRTVGRLVLPGQRSVHMKHERPRRRGMIADAIVGLRGSGVSAMVLDAGRGPEPEHLRRGRALRAIVQRAAEESAANLVLDLDQTLVARDARNLTAASRANQAHAVTYSHQSLAAQPLLAIPDVIAWCWARGGDWRQRVAPIVTDTIQV